MKNLFILFLIYFPTNYTYSQEDRLVIYESDFGYSLRNYHSGGLTNGDIVFLARESEINTDLFAEDNNLETYRNIIIRCDSLGNLKMKHYITGFNFGTDFIPTTEFLNNNSSLGIRFHYKKSDEICVFNTDTNSNSSSSLYIPAVRYLNIQNNYVFLDKQLDENYLCKGNHLLGQIKYDTLATFYLYIANNEYGLTFLETRDLGYNLLNTDTIFHTFNTNLETKHPFETKIELYPNSIYIMSGSYLYDYKGVLIDSLSETPFTYIDFNDNYFVSVSKNSYSGLKNVITIRNIEGEVQSSRIFTGTEIVDAKINSNSDVLILLDNGVIVKTDTQLEVFKSLNFTKKEHKAFKVDFVPSDINSYLISGYLIEKTESERVADKAYIYKGNLANISNEFVPIKNIIIDFDYNLKSYPNPTSGNITISNVVNILSVKIYSILGELMINETSIHTKEMKINLETFNKGIYIINAETEMGYFSKKIILK